MASVHVLHRSCGTIHMAHLPCYRGRKEATIRFVRCQRSPDHCAACPRTHPCSKSRKAKRPDGAIVKKESLRPKKYVWFLLHAKQNRFKNTLIEEINATPLHRGIKSSALLVGPVGAGKSSVVNSFLTAGAEKVIRKAEPGSDEKSVTTRFKRYDGIPQIEKYCLCDTAGILDRDNEGLHEEDVLNLMKGHIGSGYKFKEDEPISEDAEEYVAAPDDQDKSHCLAIVIPCMQVKEISDGYREKITNAIRKARNEDIPPVIILTYIDKLCSNVMRNPTKVFSCKHTEEVVDIAEEKFGVPKMYIFPLMNYSSQIVKDDRIDIINLLILKRILEFTSDYSERLVNQGEEHL